VTTDGADRLCGYSPLIDVRARELTDVDDHRLADHVRTCDACSAELRDVTRLVGILAGLPAPERRRTWTSASSSPPSRIASVATTSALARGPADPHLSGSRSNHRDARCHHSHGRLARWRIRVRRSRLHHPDCTIRSPGWYSRSRSDPTLAPTPELTAAPAHQGDPSAGGDRRDRCRPWPSVEPSPDATPSPTATPSATPEATPEPTVSAEPSPMPNPDRGAEADASTDANADSIPDTRRDGGVRYIAVTHGAGARRAVPGLPEGCWKQSFVSRDPRTEGGPDSGPTRGSDQSLQTGGFTP
jgi:hypothetical protein